MIDLYLIRQAIEVASNPGETPKDDACLALIKALLRDALGQDHGVWRWRVPDEFQSARRRCADDPRK
jgi:hypothetical protein